MVFFRELQAISSGPTVRNILLGSRFLCAARHRMVTVTMVQISQREMQRLPHALPELHLWWPEHCSTDRQKSGSKAQVSRGWGETLTAEGV